VNRNQQLWLGPVGYAVVQLIGTALFWWWLIGIGIWAAHIAWRGWALVFGGLK